MSNENSDDELTEKIKILATDDEKIKSFGELFTNDSSREILQLLFNEELTATQLVQKTGISLQLVKYHLNKLQDLGVVKITKIEKNSKSQDMKVYSATKFSIVIVPPKFSEKTKESKLLVRSFRHIYKVAGLGIATGISGLFSSTLLHQEKSIPISEFASRKISSIDESSEEQVISESFSDFDSSDAIDSSPQMSVESEIGFNKIAESQGSEQSLQISSSVVEESSMFGSDLFIPFVVITVILGGLTVYYFLKYLKSSKIK